MLRRIFHIIGNLLALLAGVGLLARYVPPSVLWPPTVIALLLPGLLILALLFTLLMAYQRHWGAAVIPAIVLICSLSVAGRLFAFGGSSSATKAATLTVATNNARAFKDDSWADVKNATVAGVIRELKADVLLLQEAGPGAGNNSFVPTIIAAGSFSAHLQPTGKSIATYGADLTTIATAVKKYNGYTVADAKTPLGIIRFINAHLQSNRISVLADKLGKDKNVQEGLDRAESMFRSYGHTSRTRAEQAEEIRRYIKESPYPVIVGGDFNDVPSSYTYQRILTPRLRDAWTVAGFGPGTTFTGPLPGLRIDFLMVDTSFTVLSAERFETGYSDHRGLRVVIE